ncbi:MAG: hypothetical protein ABS36_14920 [Acidobacteria bacterium SCN 69-37]|nr:MAG: hypothetical protein ABS36_14920 [Acidobacteria bacterium SCN 69-37]
MLSIRLPAELHDKLIQEAQRRRVDVSHVIRQRLWTPERVEALRRSEIHDRAKHRRRNGGLA